MPTVRKAHIGDQECCYMVFSKKGFLHASQNGLTQHQQDQIVVGRLCTMQDLVADDIAPGLQLSVMLADILEDASSLHSLSLADNHLDDTAVANIMRALAANGEVQLTNLDLSGNNLLATVSLQLPKPPLPQGAGSKPVAQLALLAPAPSDILLLGLVCAELNIYACACHWLLLYAGHCCCGGRAGQQPQHLSAQFGWLPHAGRGGHGTGRGSQNKHITLQAEPQQLHGERSYLCQAAGVGLLHNNWSGVTPSCRRLWQYPANAAQHTTEADSSAAGLQMPEIRRG